MMDWKPDKSRPIKPQLCEQLCLDIASGKYPPNGKLPSVREVALAAGVNPNTVQSSFEMLEGQGIVYSVRGSGWYAAEDTSAAQDTLQRILNDKTAAYFDEMSKLGLSAQSIKEFVNSFNGKD